METYEFQVHISGQVRIDAESAEAAQEEFQREFSSCAVLTTPLQDQILVIGGLAWEDPVLWVDPDESTEEEATDDPSD